jgi:hypothetical protein
MAKRKTVKAIAPLQIGDRVRIKNFAGRLGRIAELRGPLGPGGASVYRVLVQRRPTASYIELLDDQLETVPIGRVAGTTSELSRSRERQED